LRDQGGGFGVEGSGWRVEGGGLRVQGVGCRVLGVVFSVQGDLRLLLHNPRLLRQDLGRDGRRRRRRHPLLHLLPMARVIWGARCEWISG